MAGADLCVVNLECALTAAKRPWRGAPKAFYFGAPPEAIASLTGAGIDMVSLANNHVLDFDVAGLRDTVRLLHENGIASAGAGATLELALAPAVARRGGVTVAMAAFCDHQADFAARAKHPGIAYLDLHDEAAALAAMRRALAPLRGAAVNWPILSLHWGPNMVWRPAERFRRLARGAIEMGWKIVYGHSAHVFQAIELHHGRPILYAAGDLVDDYMVDSTFGNDHQLLFELELGPDVLHRIVLHPVFIADCQARPANRAQAGLILERMRVLCAEMGTPVRRGPGVGYIDGPGC